SRGPVVRAEACAGDFYSALDFAIGRLDSRLRRMADRRRVHRGRRAPVSVAAATASLGHLDPDDVFAQPANGRQGGVTPGKGSSLVKETPNHRPAAHEQPGAERDDQPWHIVREKEHEAQPMTVDDALFQMELVGHDFYLFLDKDSG